jgi:hypothetical protein
MGMRARSRGARAKAQNSTAQTWDGKQARIFDVGEVGPYQGQFNLWGVARAPRERHALPQLPEPQQPRQLQLIPIAHSLHP